MKKLLTFGDNDGNIIKLTAREKHFHRAKGNKPLKVEKVVDKQNCLC